jgi:hypothetical protein
MVLTVSPLIQGQAYTLTVNDVRDTAPSANTIWPGSDVTFIADFAPAPVDKRLANLSTRQRLASGDNTTITGFIVKGTVPKRLMVRALGPSLASTGLSGLAMHPMIELHDSAGAIVSENEGWTDNYNRQEISDTGIAPTDENEPVILAKLPVGEAGSAYTVTLHGHDSDSGTALLELYDLDGGVGSTLLNLSTRGFVGTGDDVMIGGFIVAGTTAEKVLIRAIGPSLPLDGKLADPYLELHDSNGALLMSNDNWRSTQATEIDATTIAPADDKEAALLATLKPAAYTAIVRGSNETTGIAMVEAYALK